MDHEPTFADSLAAVVGWLWIAFSIWVCYGLATAPIHPLP